MSPQSHWFHNRSPRSRGRRRKPRLSCINHIERLESRELLTGDLADLLGTAPEDIHAAQCTADECAPVAEITGPYVALQDSDIQMDGSSSFDPDATPGERLSFSWTVILSGAEIFKTGPRPILSANELAGVQPGKYTIQLTVEDASGARDTATIELLLFPNPCSLDVTTASDGLGQGTLRHSVICANLTPGADTIQLPAELGVFSLSLVGAGENNAISGDLDLTSSAAISAPNDLVIRGTSGTRARPVIDASALGDRVFDVHSNAKVTIENLQIKGGNSVNRGGGVANRGGTLTVTDVAISGNTAGNDGGGLWNDARGTMTITGTTISGNTAGNAGGGAANQGFTITITDTTISGNTANRAGGGIESSGGIVAITDSDISDNTAGVNGGGLHSSGESTNRRGTNRRGTMTITGTTISGNTAGNSGGGVANQGGTMTITDSTISGNTANRAGGGIESSGGIVAITDSDISGNTAGINGGGLHSTLDDTTILRSTIASNDAAFGGGLHLTQAQSFDMENSTISSNESYAAEAELLISTSSDATGTLLNVTVFESDLEVDGRLVVENTIFSDAKCLGSDVISLGHNLDENDTCGFRSEGDQVGVEVLLLPLGDNGGPLIGDPHRPQPLLTHAISTESPAVDSASRNAPKTDQRGAKRAWNAADIGAFEIQSQRGKGGVKRARNAVDNAAIEVPRVRVNLHTSMSDGRVLADVGKDLIFGFNGRSTVNDNSRLPAIVNVHNRANSTYTVLIDKLFQTTGGESRQGNPQNELQIEDIVDKLFSANDNGHDSFI
jgi:hypothetical protein